MPDLPHLWMVFVQAPPAPPVTCPGCSTQFDASGQLPDPGFAGLIYEIEPVPGRGTVKIALVCTDDIEARRVATEAEKATGRPAAVVPVISRAALLAVGNAPPPPTAQRPEVPPATPDVVHPPAKSGPVCVFIHNDPDDGGGQIVTNDGAAVVWKEPVEARYFAERLQEVNGLAKTPSVVPLVNSGWGDGPTIPAEDVRDNETMVTDTDTRMPPVGEEAMVREIVQ